MDEKVKIQIAQIEEEIKDIEYRIRDARWTLDHAPRQIRILRNAISILNRDHTFTNNNEGGI